jgi:hypothetical protein
MTALSLVAGNLQWLGIAKETTSGTPVATPSIFIPISSPKWGAKITALSDQALRGYMGADFNRIAGSRDDEVSYQTYLYPNATFTHLRAILGGTDAVSGAADPWSHKVSLLNSAAVPTYTLFLAMGDGNTMQVPGCVLSDVKITVKANELPTLDVSWVGLPSAIIAAPTNTPSTEAPMPPYTASITVGGASLGKYSDIGIDFKRSVQPILTLNGTQSPAAIFPGQLSVTGSTTAVFAGTADSDLTGYLTNGQPALSLVIGPQGDAVHTVTVSLSKIGYDSSDPQGSNNGIMTIANAFTALLNTTDATDGKQSPASVTIKNTAATPL